MILFTDNKYLTENSNMNYIIYLIINYKKLPKNTLLKDIKLNRNNFTLSVVEQYNIHYYKQLYIDRYKTLVSIIESKKEFDEVTFPEELIKEAINDFEKRISVKGIKPFTETGIVCYKQLSILKDFLSKRELNKIEIIPYAFLSYSKIKRKIDNYNENLYKYNKYKDYPIIEKQYNELNNMNLKDIYDIYMKDFIEKEFYE